MSRTYRRLNGDQTDRNWIVKKRVKYPDLYKDDPKEIIRELRQYHSDAGWCMSTPGWWNRLTCTRPHRVMFRNYAQKVKLLVDLEDDPTFPPRLRRPWYW